VVGLNTELGREEAVDEPYAGSFAPPIVTAPPAAVIPRVYGRSRN
jgi:hypothetical protein